MTVKSLTLGLLAALFIAGAGYLNDSVMHLTFLVGNHFPISVFGLLILVAIAANPLLGLLGRRARLRASELAVIVAMMLVACSIPGSGLMRTLTPTLVMPAHYNRSRAGWKKNQVMGYVPAPMLPAEGLYDQDLADGFLSGTETGGPMISLAAVPWAKWRDPLLIWLPLVVLMGLAGISLALIVHRQWAAHERLRYPIADFAASVMAQEPRTGRSTLMRSGLFWIGLGAIFFIHCINGLHAWFPDRMVEIPLQFDCRAIAEKYPKIWRADGAWALLQPRLYPTVVAFSFFLASDVGLSLGLTQLVVVPLLLVLVLNGVDVGGSYTEGGPNSWQLFGSYLGLGVIILYTGRRYYAGVARRAVTFRAARGVEGYAAWAFRVFLLAVAGMVAILVCLGLDWPFAVLVVPLMLLTFLVMARINAESGLFFCQARWQAVGILMGLFGAAAMGPQAVTIVALVCAVLTIDPRECLLPFVVNGLKMCDDLRVGPKRMGWAAGVVLVAGLAVAVPLVLGSNFAGGVPAWDKWATVNVPQFPFNTVSRAVTKLRLSGELGDSEGYSAWQRLASIRPNPKFLWAAGIGFALVVVASVLRLRFPRWPLHPVIFLVWNTYPLQRFSHSFLLGWLIKQGVTKMGGGRQYRRVRPLMIGVIAGDLLGGLLFMAVGAIYYAQTGTLPKEYRILPG